MAQVVDKHQVNILYTAPTAIHALMAEGDKAKAPTVRRCAFSVPWASQLTRKRGSGTGKNRQREMPGGRHLVADRNWRFYDHPAAWRYRAKSRFGNTSVLRRANRRWSITKVTRWKGPPEGSLVITDSWPGQARTLFGDHERFEQTLLLHLQKICISAATARVAMKMAVTGSPGAVDDPERSG